MTQRYLAFSSIVVISVLPPSQISSDHPHTFSCNRRARPSQASRARQSDAGRATGQTWDEFSRCNKKGRLNEPPFARVLALLLGRRFDLLAGLEVFAGGLID